MVKLYHYHFLQTQSINKLIFTVNINCWENGPPAELI